MLMLAAKCPVTRASRKDCTGQRLYVAIKYHLP
jgi:hypothetical protein